MPEIAVQIPRYSSDVVKCARADLHARTCYIRFRKFNKMAESTPRSSVGALLRFVLTVTDGCQGIPLASTGLCTFFRNRMFGKEKQRLEAHAVYVAIFFIKHL